MMKENQTPASAAFDAYAAKYDHLSDEWLDIFFKAGYEVGAEASRKEGDESLAVVEKAYRRKSEALEASMKENALLRKALDFYGRHEHWMMLGSDSVAATSLVAARGDNMNGWAVAEQALKGSQNG